MCLLLTGAGIKAQICSLVELLATTLNQAHALFYTLPEGVLPDPSLPCGLLFSTLETVTRQHPTGEPVTFSLIQLICHFPVTATYSGDKSEPGRFRSLLCGGRHSLVVKGGAELSEVHTGCSLVSAIVIA